MKLFCSFSVVLLLMTASIKQSKAACDPCGVAANVISSGVKGVPKCNLSECTDGCGGTIKSAYSTCTVGDCAFKFSYIQSAGAGCSPNPCYSSLGYKWTNGGGDADCAPSGWKWCP